VIRAGVSPAASMMRLLLLAVALAAVSACATFEPARLSLPADLTGIESKTIGDVTVSVAVLTDDQARRHFGVDLGEREVQAVWISVRNASSRRLWFMRAQLDPDYFSAEEAALMVRGDVPGDKYEELRQYFRDESIRSLIQPATITEGFVFLPRVEGGRYLDIRLQSDAFDDSSALAASGQAAPVARIPPREMRFDFAVPLPDGEFDYERMDPATVYGGQTLPDLGPEQLRTVLESLPCCVTDASGKHNGDPLNLVLVAGPSDLLNSLSRSGWSFTHRISAKTIRREIGAVIAGTPYSVAPVSNLYVFGRSQDVALQRARRSISQRNHLRLWMAPYRFEGKSVWIGQVSRDIGVKVTTKSPTLTTHVIDPQVDATREYLLQSLVVHGFVDRFGFVKGSAYAPRDQPLHNLTDDPYFSDGLRLVVVVSNDFVPPDEVRNLLWEQSAPPIAEGQSETAQRNVRPIEPGTR
jgi:hypothetical protein